MNKPPPITMPDDFGTQDSADRRAVTWAAAAMVFALAVAAMLLFGAFS